MQLYLKYQQKVSLGLLFLQQFVAKRWGYRRRFKSRDDLLRFQSQQLTRHRAEWWGRSDFYQSYADVSAQYPTTQEAYNALPVMSKSSWMAAFNRINTLGLDRQTCLDIAIAAESRRDFSSTVAVKAQHDNNAKKMNVDQVAVGLSSGTSAIRGVFLASQAEQAKWAGDMMASLLPAPFFRPQRVALFLRANSRLYENLKKGRWLRFQFFDLSRPANDLLAELVAFNPSMLVAPAQCLEYIARSPVAKQLAALKKVISVAECLPDDAQAFLTQTWQLPIHQVYQATEGFLAVTCSAGRLHLNESAIQFEFEHLDQIEGQDDSCKRVVPIITDFTRTTQLILRYRLDDILHLSNSQNCLCGQYSLVIDRIEGRCDDVIELTDAQGQTVHIYPDYISRALLNIDGLIDFRVQQQNRGLEIQCLEVQYQADSAKSAPSEIERGITQALNGVWQKHGLLRCDAKIRRVLGFDLNLMHKRRRIIGGRAPTTLV